MKIEERVLNKLLNCIEAVREDGIKEMFEDGDIIESEIEEARTLMDSFADRLTENISK